MSQNATFLGQLTCQFWGQIPHFQGEMPFMTGKTYSNWNPDHEHVGIQHALFLQKIRKMVWFMGKIYRKTTCLTLTLGFSWICLIQPVLGKKHVMFAGRKHIRFHEVITPELQLPQGYNFKPSYFDRLSYQLYLYLSDNFNDFPMFFWLNNSDYMIWPLKISWTFGPRHVAGSWPRPGAICRPWRCGRFAPRQRGWGWKAAAIFEWWSHE